MNQQAVDTLKAERDELRKRAAWYEELRQATDGGSESMTHEDAIEHVKALAAENKVLRKHLDKCIGAIYEEVADADGDDHPIIQKHKRIADAARAALTKEAAK